MRRTAPRPKQGVEVELKFELTNHDVRSLVQAPVFRALQSGPIKRKTLRATYFDTPDLKLSQRSVSLRVRKEGRRYVQCVKGAAASSQAGGFARKEWEWQLPGPSIDAPLLKNDAQVKALFKGVNPAKLVEIFTTDIRRQSRILKTASGAQVKCEIDQGRIISGDREAPIYEMELELVSGAVDDLLDLGRLVSDLVPARLSARTKAQRGFSLFKGQGDEWVRAKPVDLATNATAEDVLVASFFEGLHHLINNEDCVLTRCDVEGVHQMRVALRRMRATITLFKSRLPKGCFEVLVKGLKDAGRELGPARDWDVFVDELLPPVIHAFENAPELTLLTALADERRDAGYIRAQDLIRSHDYARLLSLAMYWIGRPDMRGGTKALGGRATHVARDVLDKRHRGVVKKGQGLKGLSIDKRHQLRIAIKKARYAAEFFAPLYPVKQTTQYLKALRVLQNELGHLNDLANAQHMMQHLIDGAPAAKAKKLVRASGMVEGWYTHAQSMREDALLRAWKRFSKTKGFW